MKVRLLQSRAGNGVVYSAGDEIEVSEAEAKRMIDSNKAIPLRGKKPVEKAVRKQSSDVEST